MKFAELKNKSAGELQKILLESKGKLRDLRFNVSANQLKDVREIRETRKLIAQILTILNTKQS